MAFVSTRNENIKTDCVHAVLQGLSSDGGLFTVDKIPSFTLSEINELQSLPYEKLSAKVLERFLPGFSGLDKMTALAYNSFDSGVIPVKKVGKHHICELFHGPTCAFKDVALQILPRLLTFAAEKEKIANETVILVATSGDTGKAALCGFADVPGTKIGVFYPNGMVSEIQRLQMATQEGENVRVFAINGNFDDAQRGVKAIFEDAELSAELAQKSIILSSANSINWGRLAPQIAYYFWSYFKTGKKCDFCVPTGNFGDILAGYLAKKSGLPVGKLVCASNQNNILTDFLKTGVYDTNRRFYNSVSPSMDILVSSNLERLLYYICGAEKTAFYMSSLKKTGRFEISSSELSAIQEDFSADFVSESDTLATIKRVFEQEHYLLDTHTAVAYAVAERLCPDGCVVMSTASPFKFASAEIKALENRELSGFSALSRLCEIAGQAPKSLAELSEKPVRFTEIIEKEDMKNAVKEWLL